MSIDVHRAIRIAGDVQGFAQFYLSENINDQIRGDTTAQLQNKWI